MTIETCYENMGGDYQAVRSRIPSDALIKRFANSFLSDPSFGELTAAMAAKNRAEAFRAVHTLKGVCANLSFEKLRQSASALTEVLRPEADEIPAEAFPMLDQVQKDYQVTMDAIRAFMAEE